MLNGHSFSNAGKRPTPSYDYKDWTGQLVPCSPKAPNLSFLASVLVGTPTGQLSLNSVSSSGRSSGFGQARPGQANQLASHWAPLFQSIAPFCTGEGLPHPPPSFLPTSYSPLQEINYWIPLQLPTPNILYIPSHTIWWALGCLWTRKHNSLLLLFFVLLQTGFSYAWKATHTHTHPKESFAQTKLSVIYEFLKWQSKLNYTSTVTCGYCQ